MYGLAIKSSHFLLLSLVESTVSCATLQVEPHFHATIFEGCSSSKVQCTGLYTSASGPSCARKLMNYWASN